ncbi:hypothetical protein [Eisenibacter elegans]|jgi:hypothetical protein|uniref:hypothetical protein n=1 Tax=Eisenibacter elegans TaxID=997 RepID=UPI0003FA5BCF|nr:hypothetical protein [Eisenibacter elegans]
MPNTNTLEPTTEVAQVRFYFLPFVLDTFARWFILGIYRSLAQAPGKGFTFFIVANLLMLLITASFVLLHYNLIKKKYSFIREQNYEGKIDVFTVLFLIVSILSVNYIVFDVLNQQPFYKEFTRRDGTVAIIPVVTFFFYSTFVVVMALMSITVPKEFLQEEKAKRRWFQRAFGIGSSGDTLTDPELVYDTDEETEKYSLDQYDYEIDRNDTEIVKLEGSIKNEATRIDAYILESVLFGALAFSAFLTIVSSERFNLTKSEYQEYRQELAMPALTILENSLNDSLPEGKAKEIRELIAWAQEDGHPVIELVAKMKMLKLPEEVLEKYNFDTIRVKASTVDYNTELQDFWFTLGSFSSNLLLFNIKQAGRDGGMLLRPRNLLMLIMLQTLLCSLFFLSVIAARLRYSNIAEEIDNLIRLARTLNDKEEEVYNLSLHVTGDPEVERKLQQRLNSLDMAINTRILKAKEFRQQTKPIVIYMGVFRNLGVFTFIVILITSSLFFSPYLAAAFLVFSIVAYVYESIDERLRIRRVKKEVGN